MLSRISPENSGCGTGSILRAGSATAVNGKGNVTAMTVKTSLRNCVGHFALATFSCMPPLTELPRDNVAPRAIFIVNLRMKALPSYSLFIKE